MLKTVLAIIDHTEKTILKKPVCHIGDFNSGLHKRESVKASMQTESFCESVGTST